VTPSPLTAVRLDALGEGFSYLRLCSDEALREMELSLKRHGQLTPVVAWRRERGFDVIDGLKRLRSARALGWDTLNTQTWEGDLTHARLMVWRCNQARGVTELEEGWLVKALYREDGLTQPQIARLVGRHKTWVNRRLMLVEGLTDGVQADIRLGLISATAAREVARLPRGNQDVVGQMVCREGMTTRQTSSLVDALLLHPNKDEQQGILEQVKEGLLPNPRRREKTPSQWLLADIEAVTRISTRLRTRLTSHPLCTLGPEVATIASRELEALGPGLVALGQTIEQALLEAEA
jgi:ParB/RepB/Spo0J family partition protein